MQDPVADWRTENETASQVAVAPFQRFIAGLNHAMFRPRRLERGAMRRLSIPSSL